MDRIDWNGSKRSNDIQDASIYLLNVTFNDSGTYRCFFNRILTYDNYEFNDIIDKVVHLTVVAKGTMPSALTVDSVCDAVRKCPLGLTSTSSVLPSWIENFPPSIDLHANILAKLSSSSRAFVLAPPGQTQMDPTYKGSMEPVLYIVLCLLKHVVHS
ncbi:hypothetical protein GOODEAATRI_021779 [Goodea atripinnis]|uniref:Ig-like domain-containing protein n=1 Tax=Goodea atripinnis TaxID=208336 RepID=A0ABV0N5M6_9TELE